MVRRGPGDAGELTCCFQLAHRPLPVRQVTKYSAQAANNLGVEGKQSQISTYLNFAARRLESGRGPLIIPTEQEARCTSQYLDTAMLRKNPARLASP